VSFFLNELRFGVAASYRALVAADIAGVGLRIAGTVGDRGLLAAVDADGVSQWQRAYGIAGRVVRLSSGVRCDDGDLMLHGSLVVSQERNESLILRVSDSGDVRWAKSYSRDRTRFNLRLVKGPRDTYCFASWYNETSSVDDVEVVRIDGAGNVLAAASIHSAGDDQANGIVPYGEGCIVCGGTSVGNGWDGFLVALDGNLGVIWQKLVGASLFEEIRQLVQTGPDEFVICGVSGDDRQTFVARLTPTANRVSASLYDLEAGSDKRLALVGPNLYLASNTAAAPAAGFVACFDPGLDLLWKRSLSLPGSGSLHDLRSARDCADGLVVCGGVGGVPPGNVALLAYTDSGLASCKTTDLALPRAAELKLAVSDWHAVVAPVRMAGRDQEVAVAELRPVTLELCRTGVPVDLEHNPRVQSPYVYLQAAGSDASDDTVRGFHLRWDLLRRLGEQHLPKGNLAAPGGPWHTTIGFNRADDFVRIYRAELAEDRAVEVSFEQPPTTLFESGTVREWLYEDLVPFPGRTTDVSIRFADVAQYDSLRASLDPRQQPQKLIAAYTGVVRARAVGKLAFQAAFQLQVTNPLDSRFRVEAVTLADPLDNTSRAIGCRRNAVTNAPIVGENIETLRFDYAGAFPVALRIATYEDFLYAASQRREWQKVGDFSLDDGNADADVGVFRRLEEPPRVVVDGVWPKFQPVADAGVFRVNAQSYRDRWRLPADGVKQGVVTYLDVSRQDVLANVVVANADPLPNDSAMELSYLGLLDFVSLDYHVARMLGLGTIVAEPDVNADARFVYLMQYVTEAQLEDEPPALVTHYYMTPPLGLGDRKPPLVPALALTYGLPLEECEGTTTALTDAAGYAVHDDVRFVNLDRARFRHELPIESFFETATEFSRHDETVPVAYGVGYGPGPVGAGNEVRPELSHHPDWLDPAGLPEVAPIPERGANPVYTHQERSAGIHHYRLYGVNWFSRSGASSAEVQTDATQFALRNTLLPPANLAAQLIQKEEPRLLTTLDEQQRLADLPPGDRTLVRVTFDWSDVQNRAYWYADTVELYFRRQPRATVRGQIAAVSVDAAAHTATLATTGYLLASLDPPQLVQPEIAVGDEARFAGARLAANGRSWLVESVTGGGPTPTLVVRQIRVTASVDANLDNSFCTVESWLSPSVGDVFMLVEDLDRDEAWETKLAKEVALVQFEPPFYEFIVNEEGQGRGIVIGGLGDSAVVTAVPDPDPDIHLFVPPGGPSSVPSGVYAVTFANRQLPATGDSDVELAEGVIRMPGVDGKVRTLRVWSIDNEAPLELTVFDSEFGLQRDVNGTFELDASHQFKPVAGYVPVQTGNVATVNFHPSYRVYLTADLDDGRNFGEAAILPAAGEGSRQTLIGARARAADVVPAMTSAMAKPALLTALELRQPVPPGKPLGPLFATRPNFFGKGTYTVDVEVGEPHSLIFFKANDRKVLDQLYQPATVRQVVAQLDALSDFEAAFNGQRWSELVHVVTGADDRFVEHVADGFRFPDPDNADYVIPDPALPAPVHPFAGTQPPPGSSAIVAGTARIMKEVVQQAIEGAFVPLTETPLVFAQLADETLQTSGRPPRLRNANGDLLAAGDPLYDPWPMAVRFEKSPGGELLRAIDDGYGEAANTRWVRFTDYTIDGAAKNVYFYFAVELTNALKVSARSPIAGPVRLVNAAPPEAPVIRKVVAQLADDDGAATRVELTLSGYLPSESVTAYRLYRALAAADALSVRTMTAVGEFPASAAAVYDDFADLADVPFARPIYYRAVALREIVNEQEQLELVPSKASDVATTQVADATHPGAPHITMSSSPLTPTHPFQYANVSLSWPRTTANGRYHLYKLNASGMWARIASVESNDPIVTVHLATTALGSDVLLKEDGAGNQIYHRFYVLAENSSGLVNLERDELTI
jgi:outer membrane protein assembly factor BamB